MARFNPAKLYIVKFLHTSLNYEQPVSAKRLVEYLKENNIIFDEAGVIKEIGELQSLGIPIYAGEQNSTSFYIKKDKE